jgi:hypothetical protein
MEKKAFGLLDIEHTKTCKQQQHAYTIDLLYSSMAIADEETITRVVMTFSLDVIPVGL